HDPTPRAASPPASPSCAIRAAVSRLPRPSLHRRGDRPDLDPPPDAKSTGRGESLRRLPVPGLPPGVDNLSAAGDDGWRIDAAAVDEALTRPAQEVFTAKANSNHISVLVGRRKKLC
ncbi:unnamed protein product, partial [Urochloa humidicola]